MKNYIKPMVLSNEELAEGVFAGSGNCYTLTARITQKPELGNEVYTIQVDGGHNATHHSTERSFVFEFNQPVYYVSSNAQCATSGDGTNVLTLSFTKDNGSYHHNEGDSLGLGQLIVKSEAGLAVVKSYCNYCNEYCDQHPQKN